MKIGIVAGEKSGDYLGSELIKSIRKTYPQAEFVGLCGPLMIEQGARSLDEMDKISIMGLDGLLGSLREILSIRKRLYQYFSEHHPDVFIGIDVPDFNLTLEARLKQLGIPTVHYVSPTVWAWRGGRIKKIRRAVNMMLTLFPFEETYYQNHQVPVAYVGHPLASEIEGYLENNAFDTSDVSAGTRTIAILPGSRMSEVSRLAPIMFAVAKELKAKENGLRFIVPTANKKLHGYLSDLNQQLDSQVELVEGQSRELLAHCEIAVLASGTAALEAALFAKPMVVMYKISWLTALIVRMTRTVEHFSMPNHLTDKPVVPELIQGQATVDNLKRELSRLLHDKAYYEDMQHALKPVRQRLTGDTGRLASEAIFSLLDAST